MKVCASYGTPCAADSDCEFKEIRMDIFDSVPAKTDGNTIITLCGKDRSILPDGFRGIVDNGTMPVDGYRNIHSVHDYESTPNHTEILNLVSNNCEICKGSFTANMFRDLHEIYLASKQMKRRHVLIGMGEFGKITRIRSDLLGNEFTYGYVGKPTAPGQMRSDELKKISDSCQITGIVGSSIGYTLSPAIHTSAMEAEGIEGFYLKFDTPDLECIDDFIVEYNVRGLNVTIPHKCGILQSLDSCSPDAKTIGAVNTVVNWNGRLEGHNTDVLGIREVLNKKEVKGGTALVVGSGGSARAAVFSLLEEGFGVSIAARNMAKAEEICESQDAKPFNCRNVSEFDVIFSCTPPLQPAEISKMIDLDSMKGNQTVIDLSYGRKSALVSISEKLGCMTVRGEEILVAQAAESFRLWHGIKPDVESLMKAIS